MFRRKTKAQRTCAVGEIWLVRRPGVGIRPVVIRGKYTLTVAISDKGTQEKAYYSWKEIDLIECIGAE